MYGTSTTRCFPSSFGLELKLPRCASRAVAIQIRSLFPTFLSRFGVSPTNTCTFLEKATSF
jgi:hypothetical protein